jgi:hypothetical protein
LNSEILNCSRCKKKDNENEVINLWSITIAVYASEKTDKDVTQTREAVAQIRQYVNDKFRAVSGYM